MAFPDVSTAPSKAAADRDETLADRLANVPQIGTLTWIGVRREHGAALVALESAEVLAERGLADDVIARGRGGSKRQVTLVQAEHLPVIATLSGAAQVTPFMLRRNLVLSGINLVALAKIEFRIGDDVVLVGTGPCEPCSRMETTIRPGAFQAMRGHGGITARVVRGGVIKKGDRVVALGKAP